MNKRRSLTLAVTVAIGLTGCGGGGGSDSNTPQLSAQSVTPAAGSTGNPAGATISATFPTSLDCTSVDTSRVHLLEGKIDVPVQLTCSGKTLTLEPIAGTPTNTSLTASIDVGVTDQSGHTLSAAYEWSFDTAPWTRLLGTAATDTTHAIATDAAGNVYVAGETWGAFAGETNAGEGDLFVTKYNKNGVVQWTRQLGTAGSEAANAIVIDALGDVYVAGSTEAALDSQAAFGASDLFIIKYDADGNKKWTRQFGTAGNEYAYAVTADASGNACVAGYTDDALDGLNAGGADIFVVKFDANGSQKWARQIGTLDNDYGYAVTTDATGNVYVAGNTWGALQASAGGSDLFLIKYDAAGTLQWTRQRGSAGYEGVFGLAADGSGNLFLAGYTDGALDGQTSVGGVDLFITRFDSAGNWKWTRQQGTTGNDYAYAVTTDAAGNIYAAGRTSGLMDGTASSGGDDIVLAKYDVDGNPQWTRQFGTAANDFAEGVAADPFGNVYVTGGVYTTLDNQPFAGVQDAFTVKYQGDGTRR